MKTSRILRYIAAVFIALLIGVLIGAGMYLKGQYNRTTYFSNTTINGYEASGRTPEDIMNLIKTDYEVSSVTLTEGGQVQISGKLEDFGYGIDEGELLKNLDDRLSRQKSDILVLIRSLLNGNSFQVPVRFVYSPDKFAAAVCADVMASPRVQNSNASLEYNEQENVYYIEPEVQGTLFRDEDLQSIVHEQIEDFVQGNNPNDSLTIAFPTEIYIKPEIDSSDVELNDRMNAYNSINKAEITYVFGSEQLVLDWQTIQTWLIGYEGGVAVLSDDRVREYVTNLAAEYNTLHYTRTFHTSQGTDITIADADNDYGYRINEESEREMLLNNIYANTAVSREPVYYETNSGYGNPLYYAREGKDDLAGNYVEVNLTTQHLWFYKNGSLVVECDIVSGSVAKKSETKTGVFPLAYKESPSVLEGADAADGYRTEVQYWMPFYDGQGLHDATWRSSFGRNIYQSNGSHGCVNMPPAAAKTLYENIEAGMAIVIYQ